MSDKTDIETTEATIVTVLEHHDDEGAFLEVAVVRPDRWQCLTVEQARDLADKLLDAADMAEQLSEELDVPAD